MAKSRNPDPINGGSKPLVTITAKAIPRSDSTNVGGVKRSNADVAKAVSVLNKIPQTRISSDVKGAVAGKNSTSDNVNAMIDRKARLDAESKNR